MILLSKFRYSGMLQSSTRMTSMRSLSTINLTRSRRLLTMMMMIRMENPTEIISSHSIDRRRRKVKGGRSSLSSMSVSSSTSPCSDCGSSLISAPFCQRYSYHFSSSSTIFRSTAKTTKSSIRTTTSKARNNNDKTNDVEKFHWTDWYSSREYIHPLDTSSSSSAAAAAAAATDISDGYDMERRRLQLTPLDFNPKLDQQTRFLIDLLQNELHTTSMMTSPSSGEKAERQQGHGKYWDNYFGQYNDGSTTSTRTAAAAATPSPSSALDDVVDVITKTHVYYCNYMIDQLQHDTPNAQSTKFMWQRAERARAILEAMELHYNNYNHYYSYHHHQQQYSGQQNKHIEGNNHDHDEIDIDNNDTKTDNSISTSSSSNLYEKLISRYNTYNNNNNSNDGKIMGGNDVNLQQQSSPSSSSLPLPRGWPIPTHETYWKVLRMYSNKYLHGHPIHRPAPQRCLDIVQRMEELSSSSSSSSLSLHLRTLKPSILHWNQVLAAWANSSQEDRPIQAAKLLYELTTTTTANINKNDHDDESDETKMNDDDDDDNTTKATTSIIDVDASSFSHALRACVSMSSRGQEMTETFRKMAIPVAMKLWMGLKQHVTTTTTDDNDNTSSRDDTSTTATARRRRAVVELQAFHFVHMLRVARNFNLSTRDDDGTGAGTSSSTSSSTERDAFVLDIFQQACAAQKVNIHVLQELFQVASISLLKRYYSKYFFTTVDDGKNDTDDDNSNSTMIHRNDKENNNNKMRINNNDRKKMMKENDKMILLHPKDAMQRIPSEWIDVRQGQQRQQHSSRKKMDSGSNTTNENKVRKNNNDKKNENSPTIGENDTHNEDDDDDDVDHYNYSNFDDNDHRTGFNATTKNNKKNNNTKNPYEW